MNRTKWKGKRQVVAWLSALFALLLTGNVHAGAVCAQVRIEIKQELTLERQAFDAMMRINNGLDTLPIDNVNVSIVFEDEAGNSVLASSDPDHTGARFFIRIDRMDNISDVSGYGSVAPATSAEIHWLIIPAPGAADNQPAGKLYYVGATLDYTLGGEPESITVTPDFITVKPLPRLSLDYFLTRQVNADDPLTSAIEPIEPYTLGVRVQNNGQAAASNLKIESAQPKIIENEQGLLIGFEIIGSSVDDRPVAPTLLTDFGAVPGNSAKVGRWVMTSTLSGEFVDFSATFTHADELGGALTSIMEGVQTHRLVRDVRVDLPGRDNVRDFLAQDGDILRVYESDGPDTEVTDRSPQAGFTLHNQSGSLMTYDLAFPATNGFAHVKLADPHNGRKVITRVVRSDGKSIPLDNAWTSKTRNRNTTPMSWERHINLFDADTTGVYSVQMDDSVTGPVPPVLQYIPTRTTHEGNQVGFLIEAGDPNGEIPSLSAAPLPAGAVFTDNGDGSAFFNWTPAIGQAGIYTLTYTATDGALSSTRAASIRVNPASDTDGDGMDDAWELAHFGNLGRDGSGDFDGDGVSDLDEFLHNTDPAAGPQVPVIQAPLYGAEVDQLQPALNVVNVTHPAGVTMTYSFEVYADAEMTRLVAGADTVPEGTATTAWTLPSALNDNTGYTWRVRAFDGSIYSLWSNGRFFVNTANDPPGAPAVSSPADGAEVDRVNPLLTVANAQDADRDALTYRFEIAEFADLSSPLAVAAGIAPGIGGATGWVVDPPLLENSYYYWQATAVDEHGSETAGAVSGFFVNTYNDAPGAPLISAPADDETITADAVVLTVVNAQDPDGDPLSYHYELDRALSFDSADKQVSGPVTEGIDVSRWPVSGLVEDTRYYWRVKASDGVADSGWAQAGFMVNAVNAAPGSPVINNPGDQAWVATQQPTLRINAATDPDGDLLNYRFELYAEPDLTTPLATHLTPETSWRIDAPLPNHQWYDWRVRAEDPSAEVSEWTPLSRLFLDDNGVNDTPTIVFTEPAADIIVSGAAVTLRWEDQDPDSSAKINLNYDIENQGEYGAPIIYRLAEDDDGAGDIFEWPIASMPNGVYWVHGVIYDGNSLSWTYAPGSITVTGRLIVPDTLGLDRATAETALTDAGLTLGVVTEQADGTVPAGVVISQYPAAGSSALPDAAVDLAVSAGTQAITDLDAGLNRTWTPLTWSCVAGADSYNIYRASPGAAFKRIVTGHVSDVCTYTDTGLLSFFTYYYMVTSVTDGVESDYSNMATANLLIHW
ncbi:MAG: PASTA domain-containing protein [Candidatus Thiodiazotropha sp. (ex Epidulcina cf. delphinae)]|nr:PASTA domain-containing protein [Candidatus Thiodiazotropha sp. (ex Epidulcina cf. delphinae)]